MTQPPYPELDDILNSLGEAGRRLSDIDATEGAAGNISLCVRWPLELRPRFPRVASIDLPLEVPGLAGATLLVTGSGRRLREVIEAPTCNVGCVVVEEGGRTGKLYTSPHCLFTRLTSEFNSHLAVHYDQMGTSGADFHAVIHAQPPYLTYLSHIERYQDESYLNQHLLRWQPETILNLPEGLGMVPFKVPGSTELMAATCEALRRHRIIVWAKHGVVARSDVSAKRASDRIEYAETAARYEYLNLSGGELASGLAPEEIRAICVAMNVEQSIF